MITSEDVQAIPTLPKRQQGEKLDEAVNSLIQNGRNVKDAVAEVAELTGITPQAIAAGFYRRKREKGEGRPRKPAAEKAVANGGDPAKASARWAELEALFQQIVNERVEIEVQARLEKIRSALA